MCHTGGPRCYSDAKKALAKAKDDYDKNPTTDKKDALDDAKRDYLLTPEVIEQVKEKDPQRAANLQAKYDKKLAGAKDYERYRAESSRTLERLEAEKETALSEARQAEKKIKKLNYDYELTVEQNEMGAVTMSEQDTDQRLQEINQDITAWQDRRKEAEAKAVLAGERMETVKATNEVNLERRKKGLPLEHSHLMPEKFAGYFADTEKKHFNENSAGSTFTEATNLNDVLTRASRQRKNLEGDDREKLIARGADPKSFAPDKRYLMVETKGKLGTVLASELKDDAVVQVIQKNEKSKPVCMTEVSRQNETDFGTIVLVDNPSLPGTEKHPSLLITAYPGASGPTGSNNDLLPHVGQSMTVAEARKIYGRDFTINTVIK